MVSFSCFCERNGLKMEVVFRDRRRDPAFDVDLATMRRILVANDSIISKASEDRHHIVRVARVNVTLN